MNMKAGSAAAHFASYAGKLKLILEGYDWSSVAGLADELLACWRDGRQVLTCGNGGSAANAIHLANDFLYGISKRRGSGLRVTALSANPAVVTCLANDEGYEHIYSMQLAVKAQRGDVLIALSGSGNSANIIHALEQARAQGLKSYAILGFGGGKAKQLADVAIHFPVHDMQLSEDLQLMVGHMVMQWLSFNAPESVRAPI